MSSSISKRFSLHQMMLEKHPLKLRRKISSEKKQHGDIVRSTLDLSGTSNFKPNKVQSSTPKIISRSMDKLEEIASSSKSLKKIAGKFSKKLFGKLGRGDKGEDDVSLEYYSAADLSLNSIKGYSISGEFSANESTLSVLSCDTSLFEHENWLETRNNECKTSIDKAINDARVNSLKMISESVDAIKEDPGTKYNKILQEKQNEAVRVLEEVHNKCVDNFDEMENLIRSTVLQKDQNVMEVIDSFRAKLEDNAVYSKSMEKIYRKMIKNIEDKVQQQREEILQLKKNAIYLERDDVLDG